LIRESYRLIENRWKLGHDIVFVWKNKIPADKLLYKQIENDMNLLVDIYESKDVWKK
jgi:RNase P protein component